MYETPGKRRFTRLLFDLAARDDCHTYGTFWGEGGDSRLGVAEGLDVLAVDNDSATFDAMAADAAERGYDYFAGNVRRLRRERDIWHADFMGTPRPENFRTVRHVAHYARRWLAVTIATDHMQNLEMQGEAIVATLPAWLTFAAEDFTLEYLSTYTRNERGLRMWVALLRRRTGKGNSHRVQPIQIAWSIKGRGYWASAALYREFPDLLPHRTPFGSSDRYEYLKRRYWTHRDELLAKGRAHYREHAAEINAQQRATRAAETPEQHERRLAYHREWDARNGWRYRTPECLAKRAAWRHQYYLDHRDQAIAAERERRAKKREAAGR